MCIKSASCEILWVAAFFSVHAHNVVRVVQLTAFFSVHAHNVVRVVQLTAEGKKGDGEEDGSGDWKGD